MNIAHHLNIFNSAIKFYHAEDNIYQSYVEYRSEDSFEKLLHYKSWIDCVQWHCEDEVRNPDIEAEQVRIFKNKIDALNQERTNLVEKIDDYFLELYQSVIPDYNARINTESPAWAIDRLSILALKIYHMKIEATRKDLSADLQAAYKDKLNLLKEQKLDLVDAINNLVHEIEEGNDIQSLSSSEDV